MNESIWKTLVYQGNTFDRFEVSTDGQIRNSKTKKIYKTCINKGGYEQVCVSLGSRDKKKTFSIHRAVAETFIPNIENKREVNHIDGNKKNNCVLNLEWLTGSENMKHASKTNLLHPASGTDHWSSKLSVEDVIYIRENYISGDSVYGARALGRKFNIDKNSILKIANGTSYVNV